MPIGHRKAFLERVVSRLGAWRSGLIRAAVMGTIDVREGSACCASM